MLGRLEGVIVVKCCVCYVYAYVFGKSSTDSRLALVHSEGKYIFVGVILECVYKDS